MPHPRPNIRGVGGLGGASRCQLANQSQEMALGYEKKKKIIIRSHLSITRHPLVMWKRKERVKKGREVSEGGRDS